jgi:hypothetical protein
MLMPDAARTPVGVVTGALPAALARLSHRLRQLGSGCRLSCNMNAATVAESATRTDERARGINE